MFNIFRAVFVFVYRKHSMRNVSSDISHREYRCSIDIDSWPSNKLVNFLLRWLCLHFISMQTLCKTARIVEFIFLNFLQKPVNWMSCAPPQNHFKTSPSETTLFLPEQKQRIPTTRSSGGGAVLHGAQSWQDGTGNPTFHCICVRGARFRARSLTVLFATWWTPSLFVSLSAQGLWASTTALLCWKFLPQHARSLSSIN